MTNINSRMSEEERKVLGKLEEFRHQSNLAIDASHKVTSKIKISVSSFISALQGKESAVTNACLACEKYVGEIKELRKIVAEVKTQLQNARRAGKQAKDSIACVLPAFERIQTQVMKELDDSKTAQRTESYCWSLMGLLAGPVGVAIAYGISVPVTECALIPNLEEHFNKQKEDVQKATERFHDMEKEIDGLIGNVDTHIKWMNDLDNHLGTLSTSCEQVYKGELGLPFLTQPKINSVIDKAKSLVNLCG